AHMAGQRTPELALLKVRVLEAVGERGCVAERNSPDLLRVPKQVEFGSVTEGRAHHLLELIAVRDAPLVRRHLVAVDEVGAADHLGERLPEVLEQAEADPAVLHREHRASGVLDAIAMPRADEFAVVVADLGVLVQPEEYLEHADLDGARP